MKINIQAHDFSLTGSLRQHVERKVLTSMSCCSDRIELVNVALVDINGPKGGVDKSCQIQVVLSGLPNIVVEDIESDLYFAISRAAGRVGRTVRRKLERQRERMNRGSHKDFCQ